MINIRRFLYSWILPPGLFFLLLLLSFYFLYKTGETFGFLIVLMGIYLLSIQIVADALIRPLENYYKQISIQELNNVNAIVVLTGGFNKNIPDFNGEGQLAPKTANRYIMGLRLHEALQIPIIISGSAKEAKIAVRTLKACGIKEQHLLIEGKSRNTAESAYFTTQLCKLQKIEKLLLVTSASHLYRSTALFRRERLNVIPYPCDYKSNQFPRFSLLAFAPSADMLCNSATAIKEYLGIIAMKLELQ